jgi:hypothetical protein
MNGPNEACVFKSCPNPGDTKISLTTGPMHYIEDKEIAGGRMVFWVCAEHAHADLVNLATSWDGQRVTWEPDEPSTTPGVLSEHPSVTS